MMKRWSRAFAQSISAASAVEFALIMLPLLLVVFGVLEFGRVMWTREALQQSAIAGARCVGLVQSGCGTAGVYDATLAQSFIQAQAAAWAISVPTANITVNASTTCAGVSGFSQVGITYTFQTAVPLLLPALAAGIPMSASACFPTAS